MTHSITHPDPDSASGRGVLVLPAWWGPNAFFHSLGERLAAEGLTAMVADLTDGVVTATVEQAKAAMQARDFEHTSVLAFGALDELLADESVRGPVGLVGFSMVLHGAWSSRASGPTTSLR